MTLNPLLTPTVTPIMMAGMHPVLTTTVIRLIGADLPKMTYAQVSSISLASNEFVPSFCGSSLRAVPRLSSPLLLVRPLHEEALSCAGAFRVFRTWLQYFSMNYKQQFSPGVGLAELAG